MHASPPMWIDTHCHLDAAEFDADRAAARGRAARARVRVCLWPAVEPQAFDAVQAGAHAAGDVYALGIHPMRVEALDDASLSKVDTALAGASADPALVAVGEIGLDGFVTPTGGGPPWERQVRFLRHQLAQARRHRLPVVVHARRAVDPVTSALRAAGAPGGIVHAFNGSDQQAHALLDLGMVLGFGGACTFERAHRLRRLARTLPLDAIVLETDAPDIPPQWLYRPAQARAQGQANGRNEPAELPAIAAVIAALRGVSVDTLADATTRNACRALPRLAAHLGAHLGAQADAAGDRAPVAEAVR